MISVNYRTKYLSANNLLSLSGFPPGMFEKGGSKGGASGGPPPGEKKFKIFQFKCLKWPILTEMTAKYGIYFY